ncbi:MAG: hypothetical protein MJY62_05760 [Bacteroidales bacterium]|nr:hypothetical protein [Bacteroidales bacterium]
MNKTLKILTYAVLPIVIILLAYLNVRSVMTPLNFEKEKTAREEVGIQRLKDIRTLQTAYKSANGKYAETMDEVIKYYKEGKIDVVMQIGSQDDSLAVANTKALKKKNPKITAEQMKTIYDETHTPLVFSITTQIPVKDTLCHRNDFVIDSLAYIPFSGGQKVIVATTIKSVSGVNVPLFEACMPYKALLRGMNHQLIVNLNAEREDTDRYPGLKVGSVSAPNNNAGNWE